MPKEIWDRASKFSIVRNPFDRVASAYSMFVAEEFWRRLFPDFRSFVQFLRWSSVHTHLVDSPEEIGNFTQKLENIIHHCSSYTNPKYRLDQMNQIWKLEQMEDAMPDIHALCGADLDLGHLRRRKSGGENYRSMYDADSERIIAEIYAADFERFGYSRSATH